MEKKNKLTRVRTGRMLAGICAGIANRLGVSVTLVRALYALFTIFTAGVLGILLYFVLTLFIPEEPNRLLKKE